MRKISPKQYAISLYESIAGKSESEVTSIIRSFVQLLADHRQLSRAKKIIDAFRDYYNEQEGIVEVTATTTDPLDAGVSQRISEILARALDKKIELENTTDPAIIGGMKLRYGDTIADGSIQTKLNDLSEHLKQ